MLFAFCKKENCNTTIKVGGMPAFYIYDIILNWYNKYI